MTTQFSRSMRSIQIDGLAPVSITLGLFTLTMLFWIAWFLLAQIPFYETSTSAYYDTGSGFILAKFRPTSLTLIQRGQPAYFQLNEQIPSRNQLRPQQLSGFQAVVSDIDITTNQVHLVPQGDASLLPRQLAGQPLDANTEKPRVAGQVVVKVEEITPASLVMRSAGLLSE